LDPGAETYTARTFSGRRYESNLLNSYGHPVPVVAGQLQKEGADRQAKVLRSEFTDAADTLVLDLSGGYEVPELQSLTRTFVYSREGEGSLTITDEVTFESPQTFGSALVTKGSWLQVAPDRLFIYDLDQAVEVTVSVEGGAYQVSAEEIEEEGPPAPITRLGLQLADPVTRATVKLDIKPSRGPEAETAGNLLRNGGFELRSWCWDLPARSQGEITDELAASGNYSLKISDPSNSAGSNINSARIPVAGAGKYVLRGKVHHVSGSGIGMYIMTYDAAGQRLNPVDDRGNIAGIGTLAGEPGQWESFALEFETPAEATEMHLWIHSYNAAQVEAYLDDLEIAPAEG
jgi:hypothetical protein